MTYPRCIFGDCIEIMSRLPEASVDLVCSDLPYGTTKCRWDTPIPLDAFWRECARICVSNAPTVLFATQPFASFLVASNPTGFKHEWIWHKSKSGSAFTARFRPLARHESVLVFGRGKVTYRPVMRPGAAYRRERVGAIGRTNNHKIGFTAGCSSVNHGFRYPESVIFFRQKWRRQDQIHPTQKPVELLEYLIETYSEPGACVLDPCMGSGSAAIACIRKNRVFIGIENDPEYFTVARQTIAANV